MTTIFKKIIDGEIPSDKVFENERFIVIKDINPKGPVHLLIIPKKEIPNFQSFSEEDLPLLNEMGSIAQSMAKKFGVDESGYRLITNNGPDSGQEVEHVHFHLIGGKRLGSMA